MQFLRLKQLVLYGTLFLIPASLLTLANRNPRSSKEHWAREYGVGIVAYADMENRSAVDTIYLRPHLDSGVIAVLNKSELCIKAPEDTCVLAFDRMVEYGYEIPGFAILSFNGDSSWAEVTLDPWNKLNSQTGWIYLHAPRRQPMLWSKLIPTKSPLFFMQPDSVRVFTQPDYEHEIEVHLESYENSGRLNYEMHPLVVRGRWMKVEIMTPSQYCKSNPPKPEVDTLWIEYIRSNSRPRVFYYTRGC